MIWKTEGRNRKVDVETIKLTKKKRKRNNGMGKLINLNGEC